jgi:hypothetical protein
MKADAVSPYRGSDFVTFNEEAIWPVASRELGQWHFLWANRAMGGWNDKPNSPYVTVNGRRYGWSYTTVTLANIATLVQARAAYVSMIAARDLAARYGLRVVAHGDTAELSRLASAAIVVDGMLSYRNVVYCPPYIGYHIDGVIVDYECQDGRTTAATRNFLARLCNDVPTSQVYLYTNPIDSRGYKESGLSGNERYHYDLFAGVPIHAFAADRPKVAASLLDSVRAWGGNRKCYVIYELGVNRPADAGAVRKFVGDRGLLGVHIWRNGADVDTVENLREVGIFANAWL